MSPLALIDQGKSAEFIGDDAEAYELYQNAMNCDEDKPGTVQVKGVPRPFIVVIIEQHM